MKPRTIYVIGALKNLRVQEVANALREDGHEVFDDWFAAGKAADEEWRRYELRRGRSYREALDGWHARHVFALDKYHLDRCDTAVLVLPAGKSAHLELGYMLGRGKEGYVLFDREPQRYDLMYLLATGVCFALEELREVLKRC